MDKIQKLRQSVNKHLMEGTFGIIDVSHCGEGLG